MSVEYNKTIWQNNITAVNETNMNNIESGIESCVNAINSDETILASKLDAIEYKPTGSTADEKRNNFLEFIRQTQTTNGVKVYYLTGTVKFILRTNSSDTGISVDASLNLAGIVQCVMNVSSKQIQLYFSYAGGGYITIGSDNSIVAFSRNITSYNYGADADYCSASLGLMKKYVADMPNDKIEVGEDGKYTVDFSKAQTTICNVDTSTNATVVFGIEGNKDEKYVGRQVRCCLTNESLTADRTITFETPTGIDRLCGVEGASTDSLVIPKMKTVILTATLCSIIGNAYAVYIDYKQIN